MSPSRLRPFHRLLLAPSLVLAATLAASSSVAAVAPTVPGTPASAGVSTSTPATPTTSTPATPGTNVTTTPIVTGDEWPEDADVAVIRWTSGGGFAPMGSDLANPPQLVITAGGKVYQAGAVIAIYPGPALVPITARTINAAGMARLYAAVKDAQLLGTAPDYSSDVNVADAPTTSVVISTATGTVVHQAYALGLTGPDGGAETTPARQHLLAFLNTLQDLDAVVGAENITASTTFVPTEYRLAAYPVNVADYTTDQTIKPVILPWPASTGVALADAATCVRRTADQVGTILADANQLTFFEDAGVTYRIAARAVLPGDPTC